MATYLLTLAVCGLTGIYATFLCPAFVLKVWIERDGRLLRLRLNRPKANLVDAAMISALDSALGEHLANPAISCILLDAEGPNFSFGASVEEHLPEQCAAMLGGLHGLIIKMLESPVPILAAVNGQCLGGGLEVVCGTSQIFAAAEAKFGQPEINLGVMAGLGGTQRLTRFVGKSKSMDMHLTGRFMDAAESESSGLVSRVVPVKKLMSEAKAAAEKITEKSLIATMAIKDAVDRAYETTLAEGLNYERRVFHSLFATEDQSEGMAAFTEKREPQFRDR